MPGIGVLLVNLGTPDAPTPAAVKRYLREFLSDRRVVEIPPLIWQPILRGVILNTRPKKSAHAYQQAWTDEGSPLAVITAAQASLPDLLTVESALGDELEPAVVEALDWADAIVLGPGIGREPREVRREFIAAALSRRRVPAVVDAERGLVDPLRIPADLDPEGSVSGAAGGPAAPRP